MNPLPLVLAELRRNSWGCSAIVALIAVAVALGATFTALHRALWLAAARGVTTDALADLQPVLRIVHGLVLAVPFAFDGLLVSAVLLIVVSVLSARRPSIGALRAMGAPRTFLFAAVWLHGALSIGAGVLVGLGAAIGLAKAMGAIASGELGFEVNTAIGVPELAFAGIVFAMGSLFVAAPSLLLLRQPPAHLLRSA